MADTPDSTSSRRLFLLDGMALVYRAHFAFIARPIRTSGGMNTSAIFGFVNVLIDLIRNEKPTHLAVVFDTSAPTQRHVEYPAYKAQREEMPEELSRALPHVKRMIQAFNLPVLTLDGWEADDIIGTLARRAEAEGGYTTWMVTPDKDFAQLVDAQTYIWKPGRQGSDHQVLGVPEVCAEWSVERPEQVIDVLGLMGDAVDNIPGIPGFGEKTAKALIGQFGSVENVIANVDKLKGKQQEKVREHAEQARLSRRLATIDIAAPVPVQLDELQVREMDDAAVQSLLVEFEFNQLGKRLFGKDFQAGRGFTTRTDEPREEGDLFESGTVAPAPPAILKSLADRAHKYEVITKPDKRRAAVEKLKASPEVAISVDADSDDPRMAGIRGIALTARADEAVYLTGASTADLAEEVAPLLQHEGLCLTGHDVKSDLEILLIAGVECRARIFDTMIAQALIEPEQKISLSYLSEAHLGLSLTPAEAKTETSGQMLMLDAMDDRVGERVMERADIALQVAAKLRPLLGSRKAERVFYEIESPLVPMLADMEAAGIALDTAVLREISARLEKEIAALEEAVYAGAGTKFNLNSPKQLGQVLFDQLKLIDKPKKTKTGQYVTNEEVLAELAPDHKVVADLLAYREATKLKSTYVDALPEAVCRRTGRVHSTWLQAATATGRFASHNPNLQNIPIRTEAGREIRRAFIAGNPDCVLVAADYSQIELRIMAALSGDPHLLQAFVSGEDIHRATAAHVYGVPLAEVTGDMRRSAKMVNFGIAYGISSFGLAQRLGIRRSEGAKLIDDYFAKFPGIRGFLEKTIADTKEHGFVETLTGRRRYLPDIRSANMTVRKGAERIAVNHPLQGTAADMIKIAMNRIFAAFRTQGLKTRMLLQVHDELVFEMPVSERDTAIPLIREIMRDALPLPVPIGVEIGEGRSWYEAHA